MDDKDILFLEGLADSSVLYYKASELATVANKAGLRHDDYDLLRKMVRQERIQRLEAELAALRRK